MAPLPQQCSSTRLQVVWSAAPLVGACAPFGGLISMRNAHTADWTMKGRVSGRRRRRTCAVSPSPDQPRRHKASAARGPGRPRHQHLNERTHRRMPTSPTSPGVVCARDLNIWHWAPPCTDKCAIRMRTGTCRLQQPALPHADAEPWAQARRVCARRVYQARGHRAVRGAGV